MNALLFYSTPLLPTTALQYLAVHLGWGLVLASAVVCAARRFGWTSRRVGAVFAALAIAWCFVPGSRSPSYWLGLAFQAPSLATDLLCIWYLQNGWPGRVVNREPTPGLLTISVASVLLGWFLMLDTLALLPWQVYEMGFSPATTAALCFVALLPWMLYGRSAIADGRTWIAPLAIGLLVVLRGPSGNVWDAVLDPWLWVALHFLAWRHYQLFSLTRHSREVS